MYLITWITTHLPTPEDGWLSWPCWIGCIASCWWTASALVATIRFDAVGLPFDCCSTSNNSRTAVVTTGHSSAFAAVRFI